MIPMLFLTLSKYMWETGINETILQLLRELRDFGANREHNCEVMKLDLAFLCHLPLTFRSLGSLNTDPAATTLQGLILESGGEEMILWFT